MGVLNRLIRGDGGGFLGPEVSAALAPNGNGGSAPAEKKSGVTLPASSFWLAGNPHHTGRTIDARTAAQTGYVLYAIGRFRASKLVEAPLWIYTENAEGEEEFVDHELARLFEEPNPDEDGDDFMQATSFLKDIDGECLWHKVRDNAGRVAFLRLYPKGAYQVEQGRDAQGNRRVLGTYRITHSDGAGAYGPKDVIHHRHPHPWRPGHSLAPADAVMAQIGISAELARRIKSSVRNMVAPGTLFMRNPDAPPLSEDEHAEAIARMQAAYTSANTGKSGLVEGISEIEKTGWTLKDIEFGPLSREVEAACCAAYNVRPEVLGFMVGLENAPWSHMETARRLSYEDAVIPAWRSFSRTVTRQLVRVEDADRSLYAKFDTSGIAALQEDVERQARIARIAGDDLSVNERRQMIGKEPLDGEEYDVVRGRSDNRTPPQPQPGISSGPAPREAKGEKTDPRAEQWKAFDAFAREQESAWHGAVLPQLRKDRERALAAFDEVLKAGPHPLETKEASEEQARRISERLAASMDGPSAREWLLIARTLAERTGRAALEVVANDLSLSFDLLQPGLQRYVEEHAAELVTQVTETTKGAIRQHLSTGLSEGESIDALRGRIEDAGAFQPSRAELIARTESTTVTNGSQREGLTEYQRETGDRIIKGWLATQDERVRDEHAAMDGEEVPIDQPFSNGLDGPSEPNCRCTTTYRIAEGGE